MHATEFPRLAQWTISLAKYGSFQFPVEVSALRCATSELDFYSTLLLSTTFPFAVMVLVLGEPLVTRMVLEQRHRSGNGRVVTAPLYVVAGTEVRVCLMLVTALLPSALRPCALVFMCDTLGESGGVQTSVLVIDSSIECYTTTHRLFQCYAVIVGAVLIAIGLPLVAVLYAKWVTGRVDRREASYFKAFSKADMAAIEDIRDADLGWPYRSNVHLVNQDRFDRSSRLAALPKELVLVRYSMLLHSYIALAGGNFAS
jgi:hypothetical protein